MRAKKGSAFEREICKRLSLWWSNNQRTDIFWRSSQSGGRATLRAQKGMTTYGSYGDIAAVDPIGEPLLKTFTIELKRGSSYSTAGDMIDCESKRRKKHPFAKCVFQAIEAHQRAHSRYWMLIAKRDHREVMVFLPSHSMLDFDIRFYPRLKLLIPIEKKLLKIDGIRFLDFIEKITPKKIKELTQFSP